VNSVFNRKIRQIYGFCLIVSIVSRNRKFAGVLMPDAAPGASRGPRQHLQAQARTPLLTHHLAYGVHSKAGDWLTVHRQQDVAQVQGTAPEETPKAVLGKGCGSGSAWIRINLSCWIRIQEGKNDPH
jgi:hypothetical protein